MSATGSFAPVVNPSGIVCPSQLLAENIPEAAPAITLLNGRNCKLKLTFESGFRRAGLYLSKAVYHI